MMLTAISDSEYVRARPFVPPLVTIPRNYTVAEKPAEFRDSRDLCSRCRKLIKQDQELDLYGVPDNCEDCKKNPELSWVAQACSSRLSKLAETLRSGISSDQSGIIRVSFGFMHLHTLLMLVTLLESREAYVLGTTRLTIDCNQGTRSTSL